jgi:hypothetical protein
VDIQPTSGAMGSTTVTVYGNQSCPNSGTAVQRCFDVAPGTPQTAALTFYYRDAEENGQDAARAWHWNGSSSSWDALSSTRDRGGVENNWVQASAVSDYSPFGLGNNNPTPTAVELARFEAAPAGPAIRVTWETATEIDNLGFDLYRAESPGGPLTRLNESLIPSQALGGAWGAIYNYLDQAIVPGPTYYYWLEALDIHGASTRHGPVSATSTAQSFTPRRVFLPLMYSTQRPYNQNPPK